MNMFNVGIWGTPPKEINHEDKDIAAFNKRRADERYNDMSKQFKEETRKIRQEMYKMQDIINELVADVKSLKEKGDGK